MSRTSEFDVALSFAGEQREYVDRVAHLLREQGIKVFYDGFEETTLWGKDLYAHLSDVYQNRARFTVMFVSTEYAGKLWTNHERRAAQARAFKEAQEYILPVRFDDTEIPGVLPTIGYLSLQHRSPEQLVSAIVAKISTTSTLRGGETLSGPDSPINQRFVPLRLEVGESGDFFEIDRAGSLYTRFRTLKLRISNADLSKPLTGCKVHVTAIAPHESDGPWLLRDSFSLAAGDHEFVSLASYKEPDDIKKSPYGATFIEILTTKNHPKPSSTTRHVLTVRATALGSPFCEIKCALWVDDSGRLRIEIVHEQSSDLPAPAGILQKDDLLAIGPNVICRGEIIGFDATEWTLRLGNFIVGDMGSLIAYVEGFDKSQQSDRYILANAIGDGRTLLQAPSLAKAENGFIAKCKVCARFPTINAESLPSTWATGPNNDLSLDRGSFAQVAGVASLLNTFEVAFLFRKVRAQFIAILGRALPNIIGYILSLLGARKFLSWKLSARPPSLTPTLSPDGNIPPYNVSIVFGVSILSHRRRQTIGCRCDLISRSKELDAGDTICQS